MRTHKKILAAAACCTAFPSSAVYLDPDGLGQALIYPYYTTRSDEAGNSFNTYLSVVNTDSVGKAVRVRFLEGAAAREVASFNVFLAPGDMWTGAVVADGDGAKVITADRSCTEPAFATGGGGLPEFALFLRTPPVATDNAPAREGFVEMIEMATIKAGSPTELAITQTGGGPSDCARVQGDPAVFAIDLDAPRGGLMGTLTLINVASGRDATLNAEALSALTTRAFYRPASDPYVTYTAPEVTPTSVITTGGKRYRLAWTRGVDAVTSVLMQSWTSNEYVLDPTTASLTDWVVTMPTRQFYRRAEDADPPFVTDSNNRRDRPQCETNGVRYFDREESAGASLPPDLGGPQIPPQPASCYSATVWTPFNGYPYTRSSLLGSANGETLHITDAFRAGRIWMFPQGNFAAEPGMMASAASTVTDVATGTTSAGAMFIEGLPIVGFVARSFSNGSLMCASDACQGNYASAFPHKTLRSILSFP